MTQKIVQVKHGGFSEVTRVLTGSTPEWNTSFLLPAFIPSYDDHVLLELGQGTPGDFLHLFRT